MIYMCVRVCIHIYIYMNIYIYIEREIYAYIYIYIHILQRRLGRGATAARPIFESSIRKDGPSLWEARAFTGHFEVKLSHGSGIVDPQFEILQVESMRTDRKQTLGSSLIAPPALDLSA